MAIQNRRGPYNQFDTSKMLPGEWAVVTSGDNNSVDGTSVYMCFAAGNVKRMATYEDMVQNMEQAAGDLIDAAITECKTAATNANDAANKTMAAFVQAQNAAAEAVLATDKANTAATAADGAVSAAVQATTRANTAATAADGAVSAAVQATTRANTAATAADDAVSEAVLATDKANKAATAADGAVSAAVQATTRANTAAANAEVAAAIAVSERIQTIKVSIAVEDWNEIFVDNGQYIYWHSIPKDDIGIETGAVYAAFTSINADKYGSGGAWGMYKYLQQKFAITYARLDSSNLNIYTDTKPDADMHILVHVFRIS